MVELEDVTCGDLMTKSSASRMDHDADLPFEFDAHLVGGPWVEDLVHHLDLCVVVSRSKRSQLEEEQKNWSIETS